MQTGFMTEQPEPGNGWDRILLWSIGSRGYSQEILSQQVPEGLRMIDGRGIWLSDRGRWAETGAETAAWLGSGASWTAASALGWTKDSLHQDISL